MNTIKYLLNIILGSAFTFKVIRRLYFRRLFPFVQAVTYHDTTEDTQNELREQLQWYRKNYTNCDKGDLLNLLITGSWKYDKPGLIITFDDGLRSNFDVALPLLEEYGFTGWFMIPPGFVDLELKSQTEFARQNLIDFYSQSDCDRIALSWEEVKEIERRGHIVTCHSMYHKRLSDALTPSELKTEIKDSKDLLESKLGHPIDSFTWVGGEEWAYGREAYKMMLSANYALIFCTNCAPITAKQSPFFLQRYHVETTYKLNRLRFVLGGFYDFMYKWKRRRVFKHIA